MPRLRRPAHAGPPSRQLHPHPRLPAVRVAALACRQLPAAARARDSSVPMPGRLLRISAPPGVAMVRARRLDRRGRGTGIWTRAAVRRLFRAVPPRFRSKNGSGAWIRGIDEWLRRAFPSFYSPNNPNNPNKNNYCFVGMTTKIIKEKCVLRTRLPTAILFGGIPRKTD